ncbi:MAG: glycosyltransferase family 9 protein [Cyanobacteria bacterium P01_A01_bin.45]
MRIVALVPGGVGDQIMFFPTLDNLKRCYPQAQIDIITEPRSKAAYRVNTSHNNVINFDFRDRNSLADWGNLVGTIREREYDAAITSQPSWILGLILWLTGIPKRITFQGKGKGFFSDTVPMNTQKYAAQTYHDLLAGLGISSSCPDLAINIPRADIEWADNEQKRLLVKDSGYILICPNSCSVAQKKHGDRIYPYENWQQIIQKFQEKQPDMQVLVSSDTESNQSIESINTFQESLPDTKLTIPGNVGQLAAMIAGANLMLCTHSSAMHLSVAVQTYTIALFGSTEPNRFLPPQDKFIGIKSPTSNVADISPETVLEKILG